MRKDGSIPHRKGATNIPRYSISPSATIDTAHICNAASDDASCEGVHQIDILGDWNLDIKKSISCMELNPLYSSVTDRATTSPPLK